MTAKLDYRWHLRQVMATRGMFATTDLVGPLAQRGIRLSSSQVYRLVTERPERLSLKILMALLDILDCSMEELIEPVAAPGRQQPERPGGRRGPGSGTCGRSGPGSAPAMTEPGAARDTHRSGRRRGGGGDHGRSGCDQDRSVRQSSAGGRAPGAAAWPRR